MSRTAAALLGPAPMMTLITKTVIRSLREAFEGVLIAVGLRLSGCGNAKTVFATAAASCASWKLPAMLFAAMGPPDQKCKVAPRLTDGFMAGALLFSCVATMRSVKYLS